MSDATRAAEEVASTSYGRLVASLAARTGDIAAAEDALSDALVAALRTWPSAGVPDRPEAWLLTVARRRLIGMARHAEVRRRIEPQLAALGDRWAAVPTSELIEDDRLRLLFVCAHPAIDARVRAPLMLQAVLGLDAARIGAAFLVAPATMGQRLVRAKTKIRAAGIPFSIPERADLPDRLGAVLDAVYAAYGSGWDDVAGVDPRRADLALEAIRLARLVVELLPDEPEARGLLALLLLSESRRVARRGPDGRFIALADQDVSRWDARMMDEAASHLVVASRTGRLGRYQLEAVIGSIHADRARTGTTDWGRIAAMYDALVALAPTLGGLVARAAAHAEAFGPNVGLAALDRIDPVALDGYQPAWVVRAHLLEQQGRATEAAAARGRAIGLTEDPTVRAHLLAQRPA